MNEQAPPTEPEAHTEEQQMVLGYCGDSRYPQYRRPYASGLNSQILGAFACADRENFNKLAKAYPELAAAWRDYRAGELQ